MPGNDVSIEPIASTINKPIINMLAYIVLYDSPVELQTDKSKVAKFLAIRIDHANGFVKLVGLDITEKVDVVCEKHQQVLQLADKKLYKEIMVPYSRIIRIQNLIYKHKS